MVRLRLCRGWAGGYARRPFHTFNGCGLLWRVRCYITGNPLSICSLCIRSRHQGGPQLPIFKAERHAAVPMVFLRTFDNMTVSLRLGPNCGSQEGWGYSYLIRPSLASAMSLPDSVPPQTPRAPRLPSTLGHTVPYKVSYLAFPTMSGRSRATSVDGYG